MGRCWPLLTVLQVIRLAVASTALGKLQVERNSAYLQWKEFTRVVKALIDKARQLEQKEKELADVNRKQQALAQLQTDIDGLKPDISLICERLVLFGEIWSSVSLCPSAREVY